MKVNDIITIIENIAPVSLACDWDNVGLFAGGRHRQVSRILLCLDVTSSVIKEAISINADLIISHHPLLISPIKNVTEDDSTGKLISLLIKNDISLYTAHTNFDSAETGLNYILANKLGLVNHRSFTNEECVNEKGQHVINVGKIGDLPKPIKLCELANTVKNTLNCRNLSFVGNPETIISSAAVVSGSGSDLLYTAKSVGADVLITGDVKHHTAQYACELDFNLIDAGHFETEYIFCQAISQILKDIDGLDIKTSGEKGYFFKCV